MGEPTVTWDLEPPSKSGPHVAQIYYGTHPPSFPLLTKTLLQYLPISLFLWVQKRTESVLLGLEFWSLSQLAKLNFVVETDKLVWEPRFEAIFKGTDKGLDITGYFDISNFSGLSYTNPQLSLVYVRPANLILSTIHIRTAS